MRKPALAPAPVADAATDAALREFLGYNMKRAFNAIQADLLRRLAPFQLRLGTFSALALIAENPGLRPSQLAEGLSVERGNLVAIVDALRVRGLVTRTASKTDGRAYVLHITTDGAALYRDACKAVRDQEALLTDGLDPAMRTHLIEVLRGIEQRAKEIAE